jgi:hypothetical protein
MYSGYLGRRRWRFLRSDQRGAQGEASSRALLEVGEGEGSIMFMLCCVHAAYLATARLLSMIIILQSPSSRHTTLSSCFNTQVTHRPHSGRVSNRQSVSHSSADEWRHHCAKHELPNELRKNIALSYLSSEFPRAVSMRAQQLRLQSPGSILTVACNTGKVRGGEPRPSSPQTSLGICVFLCADNPTAVTASAVVVHLPSPLDLAILASMHR